MTIKRNVEMKITGWHSAQAVAKLRPAEVVRAYVTKLTLKDFSPLLKFLAAHGKAYHVVEPAELDKIAESVHHEGVCLLAKQLPVVFCEHAGFEMQIREHSLRKKTVDSPFSNVVVVLEDVENPHNFGAICRVAAHFGVKALCVLNAGKFRLQGAHYRTAEGALEHMKLFELNGAAPSKTALQDLKNLGFYCVGTTGAAKSSVAEGVGKLVEAKIEKLAIFLGNEKLGLRHETLKSCDVCWRISGSGLVESLNVACAASAVLATVLGT
jgi:RNA methyltransferase, TrmH family